MQRNATLIYVNTAEMTAAELVESYNFHKARLTGGYSVKQVGRSRNLIQDICDALYERFGMLKGRDF